MRIRRNTFKTQRIRFESQGHTRPEIEDAFKEFKRLKEKGVLTGSEKDIDTYRTFDDLLAVLNSKSQKMSISEIKHKAKTSGSSVVYQDENLLVLRIFSPEAAKYYGSGTKWCITNESVFIGYVKRRVTFYFIIDKSRDDRFYKLAIAVHREGEIEVFDATDVSHNFDIIRKLGFKKSDFPSDPLADKQLVEFVLSSINHWTDENGLYNTEDSIDLSDMELTSLPVKFGYVGGGFDCSSNNLQTLEGAPREVGNFFDCSYNNLQTLEGAPREVGNYFDCHGNQLQTLEGAPREVGDGFECSYNQLKTLEGAPREVGGSFWCDNNRLQTLEGAPEKVRGGFYCSFNQLQTLEGAPEKVGRDFDCHENQLQTLEGAPETVGGGFYCHRNQLQTLEGAPEMVGGGFYCSYNQLQTLEGAPEKVGGDFDCRDNPLPQSEIEWLKKNVEIGGRIYHD